MSTLFYCGPPGSGKSYHVVKDVIIPALKKGRKIVTNLPVKLDVMASKISELKLVQENNLLEVIDEDRIRNIHELVGDADGPYAGCLIVIDEAHDFWPTDKPIKNEDFRKWYTKQRHFFQDVVLVTQNYKNVHKYMWSIVYARYEFSKNDDKGFKNGYNEDYYRLNSTSKPHRTFYSYDKFYYQFYYSHSKSLEGKGFGEQRVGKKINILFKVFLGAGIALVFFLNSLYSFFSDKENILEEATKVSSVNTGKIDKNSMSEGVGVVQSRNPVSGLSDRTSNIRKTKFPEDWCRNVIKVYVGVGADSSSSRGTKIQYRDGREGYLSGAHKVVGIIGIGSESIYLLKPPEGRLVKGVLDGKNYTVGEKICL